MTADDYVVVDGKREIRRERSVTPCTLRRSMARLLRAKGASLEDIGGHTEVTSDRPTGAECSQIRSGSGLVQRAQGGQTCWIFLRNHSLL